MQRVVRSGRVGRPAAAFTLAELLVVIVIIALLMGMLLPAIGAVRTQARRVATQAMFGVLSTGLETFRADQRLGGAYPPSRSDQPEPPAPNATHPRMARSPYGGGPSQSAPWIEVSGAGLLFWAMAGADLLGTPGFKPFRSGSTTWSQDTDNPPRGEPGAYTIQPTGEPAYARSGPYVQLDRIKYTHNVNDSGSGPSYFEVPGEFIVGNERPAREYPMFLDAFGFPILYWRADPAGQQMADKNIDAGNIRGIYHWSDNGALVADSGSNWPTNNRLRLADANTENRLGWRQNPPPLTNPLPKLDPLTYGGFAPYIQNRNANAKYVGQRPDTYLLISPGPDGIYGSGDDITNFEQHGQ